jgi:YD repeat-containing protein
MELKGSRLSPLRVGLPSNVIGRATAGQLRARMVAICVAVALAATGLVSIAEPASAAVAAPNCKFWYAGQLDWRVYCDLGGSSAPVGASGTASGEYAYTGGLRRTVVADDVTVVAGPVGFHSIVRMTFTTSLACGGGFTYCQGSGIASETTSTVGCVSGAYALRFEVSVSGAGSASGCQISNSGGGPSGVNPLLNCASEADCINALVTDGAATGTNLPPVNKPLYHYWGAPKAQTLISDPVNTATGAFTNDEPDLVSPSGTVGLDYGRFYNSSDGRKGSHGLGWMGAFTDALKAGGSGYLYFEQSSGRVTSFTPNGSGGWVHPTGVEAEVLTRADSSLALSYADGTTREFDTAGRVEAETFWDGRSITIARNADGTPSTVTASTGPSLTFAYAPVVGMSRLASVVGSWGQSVTFGYDAVTANLTSATRPGAFTTSYTNDAMGQLTKITDPSGVVTVENTYDGFNRVISQKAPSGAVTTFAYNTATLSTTVHDPITNTDVVYHHDTDARVDRDH